MEREQQSARTALDREKMEARIKRLEADNAKLRTTVVGLGAIVADAHAAGYIRAASPDTENS